MTLQAAVAAKHENNIMRTLEVRSKGKTVWHAANFHAGKNDSSKSFMLLATLQKINEL